MESIDPVRELKNILAALYEARKDEVSISPAWLAVEALKKMDPLKEAPPMVYAAANLEMRQLARALCREKFEPDDPEDPAVEQHQLWPALQLRYPVMRKGSNEEPQYKLLEHLAGEDISFNVARLRREGAAKLKHADTLEDWGQQHPA